MPEDWHCVAFGDVVDFPSKRYPATAPRIPYLSFKGLLESGHLVTEHGRSDGVEALPGDTVISRQGHVAGWIGKKSSLQIPAPIVAASTLMVFRPRRGLDGDFLSLLASWDQFRASVLQAHGGRTSASKEIMSALQVCIPPEIEQRRIVHLVGSIASYIDSLQAQVEATRAARRALVADLLSKPGEDWTFLSIEESCEILDHLRKPISATERAKRMGNVPYYGATGQAGWIDEARFDEPLVLLGEDAVDFASRTARKAYRIDGPSWVNNHAHVLRPGGDFVGALILELLLNDVDYGQYAVFGTRSKLTQASMRTIRLPVPPISEQHKIVELVSKIDAQIESLQTQAITARNFRDGALAELLSGERLLDESYDLVAAL